MQLWGKLNGVKRVSLTVDVSASIASSVSKEQVSNDAELALRTHGISVGSAPGNTRLDGILSIAIGSVRSSTNDNINAVQVRVQYLETSTPTRLLTYCANSAPRSNPTEDKVVAVINCLDVYSIMVPVWDNDELGMVGKDKLATARQKAKDLVDAFLIDWLKANEKH
ncbi:MAG: hypothetical protein M3Y27_09960 [Acidobacteriota bacterium]|nr:hypothetical protein [Acidobacteriota bacterium]